MSDNIDRGCKITENDNIEELSGYASMPININNKSSNIKNGYSHPAINKYKFDLQLNDNIHIEKILNKTYAYLITDNNGIKINGLIKYKIVISQIENDNIVEISILEGTISNDQLSVTNQNDNMFIEFTWNHNQNIICSCYIKNNNFIISPPN
jgi:hypothetical protein